MSGPNSFGYGYAQPGDASNPFNVHEFLIDQALRRMRTAMLVSVRGITGGGVGPIGLCNVIPLVAMLDGNNNATPHGVVYNLCYFRLQGGQNAVIMDPKQGDVGVALICDRDISNVKSQSLPIANPPPTIPPGSGRLFDFADGIYFGCTLGQQPNQYIQFTDTGINLVDKNGNQIQMGPNGITIVGNLIMGGNLQLGGNIEAKDGSTYTGNIVTSGDITAGSGTGDQVGVRTHKHGGVTTGGGSTAAPTAGT